LSCLADTPAKRKRFLSLRSKKKAYALTLVAGLLPDSYGNRIDGQTTDLNADVAQLHSIHKWIERCASPCSSFSALTHWLVLRRKESRLRAFERDLDLDADDAKENVRPAIAPIAGLERKWHEYLSSESEDQQQHQQQQQAAALPLSQHQQQQPGAPIVAQAQVAAAAGPVTYAPGQPYGSQLPAGQVSLLLALRSLPLTSSSSVSTAAVQCEAALGR
jgi:hypothetical protein